MPALCRHCGRLTPAKSVHMSNVHARVAFRYVSVFSVFVRVQICGFVVYSYLLVVRAAVSAVQAGRSA